MSREGIITLTNTRCYTYTKGRKISLTGEHIRNFFPDIGSDNVIRNEQKILSEVCRPGGKQMLVNCAPMAGGPEELGCALTFQETKQIQAEEGKLRKRMHSNGSMAKHDFSHILHRDSCMETVISQAVKFSYSDSNILIHGETGTGKELFVQSIHNSSHRREGPSVTINCAALPESLLESEPFGYVGGTSTGASKGREMGFFEIAHKGTILLNEIGDISLELQSRPLRVMQERKIIRLGNDTVTPIDARVICATNRDLKKEVTRGSFREGLLYRLGVFELNLPPLRKRKQDILYLADRMMRPGHERTGSRLEAIPQESREPLMCYGWSGNMRETHDFCKRTYILCEKTKVGTEDVLQALPGEWEHGETADSRYANGGFGSTCSQASGNHVTASAASCHAPRLEDTQRQAVGDAPELCGYHRGRMAVYLGVDKSTL